MSQLPEPTLEAHKDEIYLTDDEAKEEIVLTDNEDKKEILLTDHEAKEEGPKKGSFKDLNPKLTLRLHDTSR